MSLATVTLRTSPEHVGGGRHRRRLLESEKQVRVEGGKIKIAKKLQSSLCLGKKLLIFIILYDLDGLCWQNLLTLLIRTAEKYINFIDFFFLTNNQDVVVELHNNPKQENINFFTKENRNCLYVTFKNECAQLYAFIILLVEEKYSLRLSLDFIPTQHLTTHCSKIVFLFLINQWIISIHNWKLVL